jgi:HK97 family phage major capsid protein
MSYAQLARERAAQAVADAVGILDRAAAEGRDLTPAEAEMCSRAEAEADDYTEQARRSERADELAKEAAEFRGIPAPARSTMTDTQPGEIRQLLTTYNERGYAVAEFDIDARALSTSPDVNVPSTFVNRLTVYERDGAPMLDPSVVNLNTVNRGQPYIFPVLTADPAIGGTVTAEGAGITDTDATISAATATPYKVASMQTWSNELQADNTLNLEDALARAAGRELGIDINALLTTGDGSGKPEGWVTATTNGGTALGTAQGQSTDTFFSYFDLADLFFSLPATLRDRSSFMVSSTAMAKIVKMRDSSGFPIVEQDPRSGIGRTLFGKRLLENASLAAVASASISVGCGDFSAYEVVRLPLRVELSPHSKFSTDQVQLRTIERVDGKLVDATAIRYLVSADT